MLSNKFGDRLRTEKAKKEDVAVLHDQRNARNMIANKPKLNPASISGGSLGQKSHER